MLLSVVILLPVVAAGVLLAVPSLSDRAASWFWVTVAAIDLALIAGMWIGFAAGAAGRPAGIAAGPGAACRAGAAGRWPAACGEGGDA